MTRLLHAPALALALLAAGPAWAEDHTPAAPVEDAAAKAADIRRLMEITGAAALGQQVIDQMLPQFQQMAPEVPAAFWESFRAEIDTDALIEALVPIYAKHFTHAEVRELIAFYETPVGRKLVAEQPAIFQESYAIGGEWGRQVAMRVMTKLEDEKSNKKKK